MSWAAHQFETYAVQAHLPKRWQGKVSYLAIVAGDQLPDFLAKFWTYGFTINGTHYGANVPYEWHRSWPGAGFSHSLSFGLAMAGLLWLVTRNRAWTAGFVIGVAAHVLVDVNDSVGAMLLFPFSTLNFSLGTWAYAATIEGGKYLDAAAYYSSLGFAMDCLWLVIVLASWRVLTREYWRTVIVPADPKVWAWLGRRFPERVLLAFYRATFFYGVCRLVAWSVWAHVIEDYEYDLSWGGPEWMPKVVLDTMPIAVVVAVVGLLVVVTYLVVDRIVGRAPEPLTLTGREPRRPSR